MSNVRNPCWNCDEPWQHDSCKWSSMLAADVIEFKLWLLDQCSDRWRVVAGFPGLAEQLSTQPRGALSSCAVGLNASAVARNFGLAPLWARALTSTRRGARSCADPITCAPAPSARSWRRPRRTAGGPRRGDARATRAPRLHVAPLVQAAEGLLEAGAPGPERGRPPAAARPALCITAAPLPLGRMRARLHLRRIIARGRQEPRARRKAPGQDSCSLLTRWSLHHTVVTAVVVLGTQRSLLVRMELPAWCSGGGRP